MSADKLIEFVDAMVELKLKESNVMTLGKNEAQEEVPVSA